jgi:hypothetical protein
VFALLLLFALQNPAPTPGKVGKPKEQKTTSSEQSPAPDKRGTEQSPLVVKAVPTAKSPEEAAQDADDRNQKSANDRHVIWLTGALVFIGFLQFLVYAYQAKKLRETVESAEGQSKAMERHIAEASRSATAMENIADKIEDGNRAVMRAYLTVKIGGATYQEKRGPGQSDLKFEARPEVVNTGSTQARKVRIRKKADILPTPVPDGFEYPELADNTELGFATVAAHQSYTISATVDQIVPDAEIQAIKEGEGKALHVWGIITYEDIFGEKHSTKFGQLLVWMVDGKTVYGYYTPGQNDAD